MTRSIKIYYSLALIASITFIVSCRKNFSPDTIELKPDAVALNARASMAGSSIGTLQVISVNGAQFNGTVGVVKDATGNLYVADSASHVIRKIRTNGTVTVFAGSVGNASFTDGRGVAARFSNPTGIAIDAAGNLYVADKNNHAIRKITPDSVVTTWAGTGIPGHAEGPGDSTAQFNFPAGVAVDAAGNVYVADAGNNKIRKIKPDRSVSTFAGNGTQGHSDDVNGLAQFNNPTGVAVDASGTIVYVADAGNNKIRIITGGETNPLAGGGDNGETAGFFDATGSAALFNKPTGVAVDAAGNVYVADKNNNRIRIITPAKTVTTYAGTGEANFLDAVPTLAKFNGPTGVATDAVGNVYVADANNNRIRQIGVIITVSTIGGNGNVGGDLGNGTAAEFWNPTGLVADAAGNLIIADYGFHQIRKLRLSDALVTVVAGNASGIPGLVDGTGTGAQFNNPFGVAVDAAGNMYVAEWRNQTIRKITPNGVVSIYAGTGVAGFKDGPGATAQFAGPIGVAVDNAGNVYVAEYGNSLIRKITPDRIVSTLAGSHLGFVDGRHDSACFRNPSGLAIDANGNIIVADGFNNAIRKITPDGFVTTIAGEGSQGFADGTGRAAKFNFPTSVAINGAGIIYVADAFNNRIRQVTPAGVVTTLAGNGTSGFKDGISSQAQFRLPEGVTVDAFGSVYVADGDNNRIRKIQ